MLDRKSELQQFKEFSENMIVFNIFGRAPGRGIFDAAEHESATLLMQKHHFRKLHPFNHI